MVTQLVTEYTRSQPTAPNHEDTQVGNFKVYSMSLGQTTPSVSRIVLKSNLRLSN